MSNKTLNIISNIAGIGTFLGAAYLRYVEKSIDKVEALGLLTIAGILFYFKSAETRAFIKKKLNINE